MRETTIRRLLVIVLCACGVVALWIVADRSLSTPDAAIPVQPGASSPSGIRPAPTPTAGPRSPIRTATDSSAPDSAAPGRRTDPDDRLPVGQRHPNGQQVPGADLRPAAVRGLRVIQSDHDSITIRWNPVPPPTDTDRAGRRAGTVAYYHATLNGIPVGETAGLELTIDWFNDDMTSHFIRVNAVALDGTRGLSGNALVVDRPPAPSPTPPSRPTTHPRPTTSPTPIAPAPTPAPSTSSTPSPTPTTPPTTPPSAPSGTQTPGQTPTATAPPVRAESAPSSSTPPQSGPPVTPGDPDGTGPGR